MGNKSSTIGKTTLAVLKLHCDAWVVVDAELGRLNQPVDLADHAADLAAAIARDAPLPAGRLLGLPELPDGDIWCDMAGASALAGMPARTITGWLTRRGPKRNPFPHPDRVLYRLYWSVSAIREWRRREGF